MRNSQEVRAEIEEQFGFFPPFFSPALVTPEVLDSLWQQTLTAYVNNPLPTLFKESLFAYLSRYCSVPYGIVCHSCTLRSLGKSSQEILKLLESPITKGKESLALLCAERESFTNWPDLNSKFGNALFANAVRIFLQPTRSHRHREELRRLLGPLHYAHLTVFLSYIKIFHNWLEAHPEISYETDQRAIENLSILVEESPRLDEFFHSYFDRVKREKARAVRRRELRQEMGKFQILAKTTREGVILADEDGNISFCNQAIEEMFGYALNELLGRPINVLTPQLFHNALGKTLELMGRKRNGEEFTVELSLSVWRQEGRNAFVGILRDLSEQKRMEKTEGQAKEALSKKIEEIGRKRTEVALLSEMARVLQALLSAKEAYEVIGRFAPKFFPEISGALYLLNGSKILLESVVNWGEEVAGGSIFAPTDCWAMRTGKIHSIQNVQSDLFCQHLGKDWKAPSLCIPLSAQGEIFGVLNLHSHSLSEDQQLLGAAFAEPVSLALANLKLRETLRAQAIRDPLTELFNRRYMEESFLRELGRAERRSSSLGIAMLDIDHFKDFNDAHGHGAGDRLLQVLGASLQRHMRSEDIACRYGGEEFLLLLVEASLEDSTKLVEGLRDVVKRLRVVYQGRVLPPVTISIGLAAFPNHGSSPDELIAAADSALYLAKEGGRNQVKVGPEKPKISTPPTRVRVKQRP